MNHYKASSVAETGPLFRETARLLHTAFGIPFEDVGTRDIELGPDNLAALEDSLTRLLEHLAEDIRKEKKRPRRGSAG